MFVTTCTLKAAVLNNPFQNHRHKNIAFFCSLLSIVKNGRIEDGVRYIEKAIEVDCSCVQAYDTLAAFEMQK